MLWLPNTWLNLNREYYDAFSFECLADPDLLPLRRGCLGRSHHGKSRGRWMDGSRKLSGDWNLHSWRGWLQLQRLDDELHARSRIAAPWRWLAGWRHHSGHGGCHRGHRVRQPK